MKMPFLINQIHKVNVTQKLIEFFWLSGGYFQNWQEFENKFSNT